MRNCLLLFLSFSFALIAADVPEQSDAPRIGSIVSSISPDTLAAPAFVPTSNYHQRDMEGFTLLVSPEVMVRVRERDAIYKVLQKHLDNVRQVLTPEQYSTLTKTRIWIEWENPLFRCPAAYLGSGDWLKKVGMNPDKAGDIEINSSSRFIQATVRRPWMLMHELAHAWHFKVLGENHISILKAYADAMDKKLYDSVEYVEGTRKRAAYAAKNHIEYFAEITEAWFGRNDYFPFTRDDLARHDPDGFNLVKEVWGNSKYRK